MRDEFATGAGRFATGAGRIVELVGVSVLSWLGAGNRGRLYGNPPMAALVHECHRADM